MRDQLTHDLAQHFGSVGEVYPGSEFEASDIKPRNDKEATALVMSTAPRALVADKQTIAEISAGKTPSYRVILQDPKTGQFQMLADEKGKEFRWRPDRDAAIAQSWQDFATRDADARRFAVNANRDSRMTPTTDNPIGNFLFGLTFGGN